MRAGVFLCGVFDRGVECAGGSGSFAFIHRSRSWWRARKERWMTKLSTSQLHSCFTPMLLCRTPAEHRAPDAPQVVCLCDGFQTVIAVQGQWGGRRRVRARGASATPRRSSARQVRIRDRHRRARSAFCSCTNTTTTSVSDNTNTPAAPSSVFGSAPSAFCQPAFSRPASAFAQPSNTSTLSAFTQPSATSAFAQPSSATTTTSPLAQLPFVHPNLGAPGAGVAS